MSRLLHKSLAEVDELPLSELVLQHAYGAWEVAEREKAKTHG